MHGNNVAVFKASHYRTVKRVLLKDGITVRGIYERSDAKVREQEGMERSKGFIGAPFDTHVQIVENGVKYVVNVEEGQKTGFFLDQKRPRKLRGRSKSQTRRWQGSTA